MKDILHVFYIVLYLIAVALRTKQHWVISLIKVHLAHENTNNVCIKKATFHKKNTVPLDIAHSLSLLCFPTGF